MKFACKTSHQFVHRNPGTSARPWEVIHDIFFIHAVFKGYHATGIAYHGKYSNMILLLCKSFKVRSDWYACQWKYYDYTPISIMQRNSHFFMKTDWPLILGTCLFQSYYLHLDDITYVFNLKLPWHRRHEECDGVSHRQPLNCLLNCLFRRRSKNTSKLRVTGRSKGQCRGNFFHLMTS